MLRAIFTKDKKVSKAILGFGIGLTPFIGRIFGWW
jgi:hypothetical protein